MAGFWVVIFGDKRAAGRRAYEEAQRRAGGLPPPDPTQSAPDQPTPKQPTRQRSAPPPPPPPPPPKPVVMTDGEALEGYRLIGAAVQGPSHVHQGTPCDDRFHWAAANGRICAVVSDGAGSAKLGRYGAEAISEALAEELANHKGKLRDIDELRDTITLIINCVKRGLAKNEGVVISDYHATLVGAVWDKHGGVLFHVGDGVAASLNARKLNEPKSWANAAISEPENGDSSDQTYFFTMEKLNLKLKEIQTPTVVALMSDGAAGLAYLTKENVLEGEFFAPIMDRWARMSDDKKVAEQLAGVLTAPGATQNNDDDKCLLIAVAQKDLAQTAAS